MDYMIYGVGIGLIVLVFVVSTLISCLVSAITVWVTFWLKGRQRDLRLTDCEDEIISLQNSIKGQKSVLAREQAADEQAEAIGTAMELITENPEMDKKELVKQVATKHPEVAGKVIMSAIKKALKGIKF